MKILAVAAHHDDAEWGAGGTLARFASAGDEITTVVISDGKGGTPHANQDPERFAQTTDEAKMRAAKILGFKNVVLMRYCSDGEITNSRELREELMKIIRRVRPDVIFTTDFASRTEFHTDHIIAGRLTLEAGMFAKFPFNFPGQLDEGLKPHWVKEYWFFCLHPFLEDANAWVDITNYFDKKIEALSQFETQMQMYGWLAKGSDWYPEIMDREETEIGKETLLESVRIDALNRGRESDKKYAEAFRVFKAQYYPHIYLDKVERRIV